MSENFNPFSDFRKSLQDENACDAHPPIKVCDSLEEAELWWSTIQNCSESNRHDHLRWFCKNDLFFFTRYILHADYLHKKWFFDLATEVRNNPINTMWFVSRGAGKSTFVTFAQTIQDLLNNPNHTFGIFSHTRPIAKQFLRQIKVELETNDDLKNLFPEVFYADPKKESPKWSEDDGIVIKRTSNAREASVEAWGLVDSSPTGKHFVTLIYDDVVTEGSVTSADMIEKTTSAWELSLNLTASDPIRFRVAGTFYAAGDTYSVMMERGFGKVIIKSHMVDDHSLLLSDDGVALLKQTMSVKNFALQILLDLTKASEEKGFRKEWLKHWTVQPSLSQLNRYIFVDPGGKGEESTSYTGIVVVGLAPDKHCYILYLLKDRLSLIQRCEAVFQLHREFAPLNVFYERYSMQSDIEAIQAQQSRENYRFAITEVGALSGGLSKDRRIEKLQPDFSQGLILLPPIGSIKRKMFDGKEVELVENFINKEYLPFPFTREKDLLDALSRKHDPRVNLVYPRSWGAKEGNQFWHEQRDEGGSWLAE